jgi:hypothetical protein
LEKHHKALSTEPKEINEVVWGRIQDLVLELSREMHIHSNEEHIMDNFSLGQRATVESSCSKGGELGLACEELTLRNDFGYHDPITSTLLGYVRPSEGEGEDLDPEPVYAEGYLPSIEEIERFYPNDKVFESFEVKPSCIIEPLKVRIITKPNVGVFTRLRGLQKKLWSFLANHHSGFFDLIGEPLERRHLWSIAANWQPGEFFCSGDYSAATDNLKKQVSHEILRVILQSLFGKDTIAYHTALNSMLENEVLVDSSAFPQDDLYHNTRENNLKNRFVESQLKVPLDGYKQKNGQLMGNVLSFPILCIANYLAYHISRELEIGKLIPLWQVPPVKINGDDILFKCTRSFYPLWVDVVSEFGFFPSLGKNLLSDTILQINSELYYNNTANVNGVYRCTSLTRIPFINFGLCTFRGKQDCSRDLTLAKWDLRNTDVRKAHPQSYYSQVEKFRELRSNGECTKQCQVTPVMLRVERLRQQLGPRAVNAAEIYQKLRIESGFLFESADKIFRKHFRTLELIFPGIEVDGVYSSVFNKCLFKDPNPSPGATLTPELLTAFSKRFPSLKLEKSTKSYLGLDKGYARFSKKWKSYLAYLNLYFECGLDGFPSFEEVPSGSMTLEIVA